METAGEWFLWGGAWLGEWRQSYICFADVLSLPDRRSPIQKPCAEKQDILARAWCHAHMVIWLLDRAGCHLACVKYGRVKSQLSAPIHLDILNIWLEKQVVNSLLSKLASSFLSFTSDSCVSRLHPAFTQYLHHYSIHLVLVINVP